jgi:diguanylate cyclase (GGDEF)-like protein
VKPPRPLARVLLHKAIAGYLIFAVGITGLQLFFEYRNAQQETVRSLNALARTFAPGAASALWNYQEDLLQSLTHGIGEHELVEAVGISDFRGRINANWRASNDATSSNLTVQQTLYHHFEDGQQEPLGTLTIASSHTRVFARLQNIAWSVSLSIAAQLLFLGGMLVVLAKTLVVKPLTQFAGQISQWTVDGQEQPINPGPVEIAEIATLQQGFNRLLQRVVESHALITAANAELEQRVAERTRNLDARNQELAHEHHFTLALVRSIPGFVCILDDAGRILIANHAAGALIGHPGVALVGHYWSSLDALVLENHPLKTLFHQAHTAGSGTAQASFPNNAGQEHTYQFEALRVGSDADMRIIVVGVDITKQYEQALRLQHQAFHDRLTGLPNRALFIERLEQTIIAATRRKARFAVAFIDLDQFKPINDSAGHEAGDAVLQEIASRLRQCVRESDTVARLGGDEFVLLLLDSTHQGLQRVAEAILATVAQPINWQDAAFTISASIGFAVFPQNGENIEDLLSAADASMYRAKQAGRNQADFGALPIE